MPFSLRPSRRFPVHCAVTYHAGQSRAKAPCGTSRVPAGVSLEICRCGPPCAFLSPLLEYATLRAFAVRWMDFEPLKEVLLCGSA
jgi:hypothetical protein